MHSNRLFKHDETVVWHQLGEQVAAIDADVSEVEMLQAPVPSAVEHYQYGDYFRVRQPPRPMVVAFP